MPPIVQILLLLFIGIAGVLFATRNSQPLNEEQASRYSKILRILIPLMMIGAAIKYFFFR
jgi:threonine/homoserine/homoserine lactone efflux protein